MQEFLEPILMGMKNLQERAAVADRNSIPNSNHRTSQKLILHFHFEKRCCILFAHITIPRTCWAFIKYLLILKSCTN